MHRPRSVVVYSLGDHGPPRPAERAQPDVLQLQAEFLIDHLAAGEDPHVRQHRLAAVTEPGRLHRDYRQRPLILFTTRVDRASPSISCGDHQQRPLVRRQPPRAPAGSPPWKRSSRRAAGRRRRPAATASSRSWSVMKYGEMWKPLSNCMPSVELKKPGPGSATPRRLVTPSLPTLPVNASAISLPISASCCGDRRDMGDLVLLVNPHGPGRAAMSEVAAAAASMPRLSAIRVDAPRSPPCGPPAPAAPGRARWPWWCRHRPRRWSWSLLSLAASCAPGFS